MKSRHLQSLAAALLLLLIPLATAAQTEEPEWMLDIQPYLFLASLEGDSTISGKTVGANVDVDLNETLLDLLGGYRIQADKMAYDLFAGLRLMHLKQQVDITPLTTLPSEIPSQGGTESWVEPVLGARAAWHFADKFPAVLRGDVGGFGIGDASGLTWNLIAGVGYQPTDHIGLRFAYRFYSLDFTTGSGPEEFALDAELHGPWLGLGFIF